MRLARFILDNLEAILSEWENFARSLATGAPMSIDELRDDAERMLRFIAADMETTQTREQELTKALGHGPGLPDAQASAAQQHGIARAIERFSLVELVSEYRALRASVTRLWIDAVPVTQESVAQIVRFNEAIDQILAEGVATFTEHVDQQADLFTAAIGHDLSNPLNAVALSARRLMVSPNLPDNERAAVELIEHASQRLAAMLADLRDFTRSRLGGFLIVHRKPCDVADLVRKAVSELESAHAAARIDVECRGDLVVSADPKRVSQLLSNLVANALQHGAEHGDVQVSAWREADGVAVEIRNAGPAIDPALMKRLFDPQRGPQVQADNGHLGLGLYIAQQIAVAHGGTIEARSSAATGTCFTVRLPAEAADAGTA